MENKGNCKSIRKIEEDLKYLTEKMDQKILNQLDIYLKEISTEILNVLTLDDVKYDRVVDVSMKIVNKHKNYQELIKYIEKFKRSDNFNKEKELIMTKWGNLVNTSISKAFREED